MNLERDVYGRLTINGERQTLGRASVKLITQRFMEQYKLATYRGEKLQLIIEISDDPFTSASLMSREQQLEAEMQSLINTNQDDEAFPGVTLARVSEVMATREYSDYEHICEPSNRIGVEPSQITSIRQAYTDLFPDCVQHFPLWRDS